MEAFLQTLFDWIPADAAYYAIVGLIAFIESLVGIGLIMPGSVLTVFAGFLAAHGKGEIGTLVLCATIGAIGGDVVSYVLGGRFGIHFLSLLPFKKHRRLFHRAEFLFSEHGGKSLFIGRFLGPIRGFIPFVAGIARMRPGSFVIYTIVSGILWGIAYPGLGFLGGASWQKVQMLSSRLGLIVLLLALLFILNELFWKKLVPPLTHRIGKAWKKMALQWTKILDKRFFCSLQKHFPGTWQFIADRFSLRRGSGLYLTTGFSISALFILLFFFLVKATNLYTPLVRLDLATYVLIEKLHHPASDTFFIIVTLLGNGPVVIMITALTLLWLILKNRDFSAVILLAGTAGGYLLVWLLKGWTQRARPIPYIPSLMPHSASFPSAHAFMALVLYGLLVYLLMDHIRNWQSRFHLVVSASFICLLLGFSRIYLGVHWLTDVLAGFVLATIWLTFLITASEMRRRYGGEFPWRSNWEPPRLPRQVENLILTAAGFVVLGGVATYIYIRLSSL